MFLPESFHNLPMMFLFIIINGLLLYFILSGLSYYFFFVKKKDKYHPKYKRKPEKIKSSIKWAVVSLIGNAVVVAPLHLLILRDQTKIYYNVGDYGIAWLIFSIFLYLFVTETSIYWTHRWLHWKKPYKHLHYYHHQFRLPTPWASVAFHPVDSFAQALPHHLCMFLFPVHIYVYLGFLTFVTVWAVMIHDRVSFINWKVINYTDHHTAHHWYNNYNFGQFFTFWDRLGGTYKDPDELPPQVFEN
ncbi:MAG: sterol desaturase family protein [Bacteroidetes bacterium]|nr:sterol desaturase family protein [Bacteroidota bacterium]